MRWTWPPRSNCSDKPLRSVPAAVLQALAAGLRERRSQAGDVIFRKGDTSEALGIVSSRST